MDSEITFSFETLEQIKLDGVTYATECYQKYVVEKEPSFSPYQNQLYKWLLVERRKPDAEDEEERRKRMYSRLFNFFGFLHYKELVDINPHNTRRQASRMRVIEQFITETDVGVREMILRNF